MTPENKALMDKYPQYYRDVSHLEVVDVYRVIDLFGVTDATAQHALKKLLLSGVRTGGKSIEQDLKEARDTLSRGLAMRAEDSRQGELAVTVTVTNSGGLLNASGIASMVDGIEADIARKLGPCAPALDAEYVQDLQSMRPQEMEKQLTGSFDLPPTPVVSEIATCTSQNCDLRARDNGKCIIHRAPVSREPWPPVTVPPAQPAQAPAAGPAQPPKACR